jgi:iron-sulfur cluster repair protein YtfE (RIC family)
MKNEDASEGSALGKVDFTLMYAFHDAFRRDLQRLGDAAAADRAGAPAARAGWATLKKQLHLHHLAEDTSIWPVLRAKINAPSDMVVIDRMEAEHAGLDGLVATVDVSLDGHDPDRVVEPVRALAAALVGHMEHEERDALPLIEIFLGVQGWDAFRQEMRRTYGIRGGAELFPWMLDGASATTTGKVLRSLPPPARVLYRMIWRASYARTPRWENTAA